MPGTAPEIAEELRAERQESETTPRRAVLVNLGDVVPERVEFLWAGYVPAGKITVIDGDPSVGKSTLTLDWAAHVTTGTAWPDGSPCREGGVVLLSAEDGLADTIRPRLDAAGANPSRVVALQAVRETDENGECTERTLTLRDVSVIEEAIESVGARLVVIDVVMAYLPSGVDSNKDSDVRSVLHRLSALAQRTGAAIVLIRHMNKSTGGSAMYRGGGSIGIIGAARAGFVAARSPEGDGTVILACTKSNLCREPPSLVYRVVESAEHGTGRIEWLGESSYNAHDVTRPTSDDDVEERDALATFLVSLIKSKGGRVRAPEAVKAASSEFGCSRSAVTRARTRAGIKSVKNGMDGGWFWTIEEVTSPPEESEEFGSQEGDPFDPFVIPSTSEGDSAPAPIIDLGPCARCRRQTVRYGDRGHVLCQLCSEKSA